MNTSVNIILVVFVFLFLLHLSTYAVNYNAGFVAALRVLVLLFGWTIILLTIISILTEIGFSIAGNKFYIGRTIWAVIRFAITVILVFSVYFLEYFLNGEFKLLV